MSEPTPNPNFDGGHIGEPPAEPTPHGARPTYPAAPAEPYGGYSTPGAAEPANQSALLSLIFGILSFFTLGLILSIPAIIIGNKAKRELAASGSTSGASMAATGVVLGWIQVGLTAGGLLLLVLIFGVSALTHTY